MHYLKEQNTLLVADTYNHKIKIVFPNNTIQTIHGGASFGLEDGEQGLFSEPTGFASKFEDGKYKIYVADSNNDCIRIILDGTVTTPLIKNVPKIL